MFCWLYRFMISTAADADNRLSARTKRHLGNCAYCQGFHEMCLSLGEGLRSEAAHRDADDELPAQFGRRVLEAVPERGAPTYKLPIRWARPALAAACIAVAALIGVFFLRNEPPVVERARTDGLYNLMGNGHPAAWARLVDKPLAGEIENLADGTESAVRFLVACVAVNPTNAGNELPN